MVTFRRQRCRCIIKCNIRKTNSFRCYAYSIIINFNNNYWISNKIENCQLKLCNSFYAWKPEILLKQLYKQFICHLLSWYIIIRYEINQAPLLNLEIFATTQLSHFYSKSFFLQTIFGICHGKETFNIYYLKTCETICE